MPCGSRGRFCPWLRPPHRGRGDSVRRFLRARGACRRHTRVRRPGVDRRRPAGARRKAASLGRCERLRCRRLRRRPRPVAGRTCAGSTASHHGLAGAPRRHAGARSARRAARCAARAGRTWKPVPSGQPAPHVRCRRHLWKAPVRVCGLVVLGGAALDAHVGAADRMVRAGTHQPARRRARLRVPMPGHLSQRLS